MAEINTTLQSNFPPIKTNKQTKEVKVWEARKWGPWSQQGNTDTNHPSIHQSIHPSVHPSICPSISPSIQPAFAPSWRWQKGHRVFPKLFLFSTFRALCDVALIFFFLFFFKLKLIIKAERFLLSGCRLGLGSSC